MPYKFVPDSFHTHVTAEALREKIYRKSAISHQRGHFDPKFQDRSFFHFVRDHACDRQTDRLTDKQTDGRTDRQTKFSSLDRVCISCSAVKILTCLGPVDFIHHRHGLYVTACCPKPGSRCS